MEEYVTLILTTETGSSEFRVKKNIEELTLTNLQLISISDNLSQLTFLRKFNCSSNEFTSLPALPVSLEELNCSNCELTALPVLPGFLEELNCSYNRLASLPALPSFLIRLYCNHNRLTALPSIPAFLQLLCCTWNQLASLPSFLASLRKLDCSDNKLASLPTLPVSLEELDCHDNQLKGLPTLPVYLEKLDCSYNRLASLPAPPAFLVTFFCHDNQLTSLPMSLLQCRHLRNFLYLDNPIGYISPDLRRFINQLRMGSDNNDTSSIRECIRQSIYRLVEVKPALTTNQCLSSLSSDEEVEPKTKKLLLDYLKETDTDSALGVTFRELFTSVWSVIVSHPDHVEIKAILNQQMDGKWRCFTERMSRLVNCLNGYDKRVIITMSLMSRLIQKYNGEKLKSN